MYISSKNEELVEKKEKCAEIIDDVKQKLQKINKEEAAYINLYQKRVEDIKLAIADVMKQFSELENMVPSFMENKRVENQQHLEKLALKFKDELQSIEKENEEMLAKLKEKRLEMVAELAEQTGNIISGYNASINEVNSGIYELERTYRVLIKDELQKHKDLVQKIKDIKEQIAKQNEESFKLLSEENATYKEKSQELNKEYKLSENDLSQKYKPFLSDSLAELVKLEETRKTTISEIDLFRNKINHIDEEIASQRDNILLEYLVRIKEIARDYEKSLNQNKQDLKNDDILKSSIVDIFKNIF